DPNTIAKTRGDKETSSLLNTNPIKPNKTATQTSKILLLMAKDPVKQRIMIIPFKKSEEIFKIVWDKNFATKIPIGKINIYDTIKHKTKMNANSRVIVKNNDPVHII